MGRETENGRIGELEIADLRLRNADFIAMEGTE
jgi:hypothetical protein